MDETVELFLTGEELRTLIATMAEGDDPPLPALRQKLDDAVERIEEQEAGEDDDGG